MAEEDKTPQDGEEEEEIEGEEWEEGDYEIAYIMKDKVEDGVHKFFVHWKGWSHIHDSWATRADLDNCDDVLAEYFKKKAADEGKKKVAGKKSRLAPSTSRKPSNRPNPRKEKPICKRNRTSGSRHSLEKEPKKPKRLAYLEPDSDDEEDKKPDLNDEYAPSRSVRSSNRGRGRGSPASSRQSSVAASTSTVCDSHRRSSRLSSATRSTPQPFPEAVVKSESAEEHKEKQEKAKKRSSRSAVKQEETPVNEQEPVNVEVISDSIRRRMELKAQQKERIEARELARRASRHLPLPPMEADPNMQESRPQSACDIGPDDLVITAEDVLYTDLFVRDEPRVVAEPAKPRVPEGPSSDVGLRIEDVQTVPDESDNDDDLLASEQVPQLEDPKISGFALGLKARILTLALKPDVKPEQVTTSRGAFAIVQFHNRNILEVHPICELIQRDPNIFNSYVARINAREKELGMDVTKPTGFIQAVPENLDNW